ncbi:MAG: hypothetical protein OXQ28_10100, partial [Acidobacteriota bacterium]|nr:hypothetical protein [Acidobacteriota bacterium]
MMTKEQLAKKLREILDAAEPKENTTMTYVFGILFAEHIGPDKVPAKQIVEEYQRRYGKCDNVAVGVGKNLAAFVNVRKRVV